MIRSRHLALVALVLALAPCAGVEAQVRPVRITVDGLFGEETLLAEGWVPALITLENLTAGDLHGEVHVEVGDYRGAGMRRAAILDLPARQTRTVVMPVFSESSGGFVRAVFEANGGEQGGGETSIRYAPGGHSVVVFGDPPRLRGGLLDLDVFEETDSSGRQVRVPIGVVRFDAATADPMLPETALGYSTVKLMVAHTPALARTSPPQRRAIEDWLRAGGRLLVFPRAPSDLDDAWLVSLAGRAAPIDGVLGDDPLVARTTTPFALSCDDSQLSERFGCSRDVGRGRIYLASYDGMGAAAIETGAPRELVRSIYGMALESRPALPLGRGVDNLSSEVYGGPGSLGRVRALLDPNEGFRPALGLVAVVLLLYVLLVGPINFRWVQKRGRPTLALLTTPALAAGCVLLLLLVGYIGKGVTMRYRRVELVEASEGQSRATSRRYTGYFATRPGRFDLPGAGPDGLARRIAGSAAQGPTYRHEGDAIHLRDVRAGLWETVFIREDRLVGLGGAIRFTRDGRRLASVSNETSRLLRGAIVVDIDGAVYAVGDVAPGVTAPIPETASSSLNRHAVGHRRLARLMRLGEDDHDLVRAMTSLAGLRFVPTHAPVLYAVLDPESPSIGPFRVERDARWLRITPTIETIPVSLAPPPEADPYARTYPPTPVVEDPLEQTSELDAGVAESVDGESQDGGS